jgi:hypothetical protein
VAEQHFLNMGGPNVEGQVIVRLSRRSATGQAADPRRFAAAMFAGLVIVVGAVYRVMTGGQAPTSLLVAVTLAAAIILALFVYAWLRRRNASVFFDRGMIGVTNALGFRQQVPTTVVDRIELGTPATPNSSATLLIVRRDRGGAIKFRGADRLDQAEIRRLAEVAGLPLRGSFDQSQPNFDLTSR